VRPLVILVLASAAFLGGCALGTGERHPVGSGGDVGPPHGFADVPGSGIGR
jgi:hypothetical protein